MCVYMWIHVYIYACECNRSSLTLVIYNCIHTVSIPLPTTDNPIGESIQTFFVLCMAHRIPQLYHSIV